VLIIFFFLLQVCSFSQFALISVIVESLFGACFLSKAAILIFLSLPCAKPYHFLFAAFHWCRHKIVVYRVQWFIHIPTTLWLSSDEQHFKFFKAYCNTSNLTFQERSWLKCDIQTNNAFCRINVFSMDICLVFFRILASNTIHYVPVIGTFIIGTKI